MPMFQTRPQTIEAEQFIGDIPAILRDENNETIPDEVTLGVPGTDGGASYLIISAPSITNGTHLKFHPGDWVTKEEDGRFGYWSGDTFSDTFEPTTGETGVTIHVHLDGVTDDLGISERIAQMMEHEFVHVRRTV